MYVQCALQCIQFQVNSLHYYYAFGTLLQLWFTRFVNSYKNSNHSEHLATGQYSNFNKSYVIQPKSIWLHFPLGFKGQALDGEMEKCKKIKTKCKITRMLCHNIYCQVNSYTYIEMNELFTICHFGSLCVWIMAILFGNRESANE